MELRRYDTDLTDAQFALVEPFLPRPKRMGRPPADLRAVHDSRAACDLFHSLAWEDLPRLRVVYTDSHYTARYLDEAVFSWAPFRRVVVSRPEGSEGYVELPQRWVVERTFAWLYRSRRLSKDYEREPASSEAMIRVSMIHLMLRRLAPAPQPQTQCFRYAA